MSCGEPIVIGETCDDQINYGETIDFFFDYKDEEGAAIDLTTATVAVFDSTPDAIKNHAVVTVETSGEYPLGRVRFLMHRDYTPQLRRGRQNSFSLQVIFGADSDDITPEIFLQVT